jgi:hypothetical protein
MEIPVVNINPNISPTTVDPLMENSVWTAAYSVQSPMSIDSLFQQIGFSPPNGNTESPGTAGTTITVKANDGSSLTPHYTGAWAYNYPIFPGNCMLAFAIIQPSGGWPTGQLTVTITLTYAVPTDSDD